MNGTTFRRNLTERPYIIAIVLSVILLLWMLSGFFSSHSTEENAKKTIPLAKVKVRTMNAQKVHDVIELYGRTEPDRITTLKAELDGKIASVLAKRGSFIKKDQIIARIETNDLTAQLRKNKTLLKQREIEYKGTKRLNSEGYQGEVQLSIALANLENVKAEIERLEITLENTIIRAPFDGVLNNRFVEQGDYVKSGDDIAMVADLDPLIVRAHVTENQIGNVFIGQYADIRLLDKSALKGDVRYIASVADDMTNTFKIEIAVNNSDYKLLAGLSSEIEIALEEVDAIKLSPALLALDEQGNIGVKTVVNEHVNFVPINVVKTEGDGIWLQGLGKQADIIILGQGFVRAGDNVNAIMDTSISVKE